ncbi:MULTISPECIES: histidine kinase [unclassified Streptomyces]|uniref:histidine kinase n=1 Tax=unclassified Streptomyces TaxID=2593676 RepID=UPI004041AAAD
MVVQATAAREVLAVLPDPAETALEAVEGAGRDAMTELRPLLGLLAPSPEATTPPGTAKGTCPGSHRSRARADSAPLSTGSRSPACRPRCASPVNRARCRPESTSPPTGSSRRRRPTRSSTATAARRP